jgi:hypothetical protein
MSWCAVTLPSGRITLRDVSQTEQISAFVSFMILRAGELRRLNPMAEDSFEKARNAFFGTVTPTAKLSTPLAECLEAQASLSEEVPLQVPYEEPTFDLC